MSMFSRVKYDMPRQIKRLIAKRSAQYVLSGVSVPEARHYAKLDVRRKYLAEQASFEIDYPQFADLFRKTAKQHLGGTFDA